MCMYVSNSYLLFLQHGILNHLHALPNMLYGFKLSLLQCSTMHDYIITSHSNTLVIMQDCVCVFVCVRVCLHLHALHFSLNWCQIFFQFVFLIFQSRGLPHQNGNSDKSRMKTVAQKLPRSHLASNSILLVFNCLRWPSVVLSASENWFLSSSFGSNGYMILQVQFLLLVSHLSFELDIELLNCLLELHVLKFSSLQVSLVLAKKDKHSNSTHVCTCTHIHAHTYTHTQHTHKYTQRHYIHNEVPQLALQWEYFCLLWLRC